jgi:hypothetical protein
MFGEGVTYVRLVTGISANIINHFGLDLAILMLSSVQVQCEALKRL